MKFYLRLITVALLSFLVSWNVVSHYDNERFVASVNAAQANINAISDAQDFATPLVELSTQLASENAMFTEVVDRARDIVIAKELELTQVKEALNGSIELLQEQIVENNQCVDEIRALEDRIKMLRRTISELMRKIPNPGDMDYPYDPAYN